MSNADPAGVVFSDPSHTGRHITPVPPSLDCLALAPAGWKSVPRTAPAPYLHTRLLLAP